MEGVMMRGPKTISIAVRKEDKSLIVHKEDVTSIGERFPILKKPFIRGTVSLVESLVIGMKALTFSANQFASEDEQEELSPKRNGPHTRSFLRSCHTTFCCQLTILLS